ncbi:MAG: hypothetical protein IJJ19_07220 [Erysipelotrichaceae bacterium]|nr:hypothetical protein [Erysipelotrichaceae bacterium]
MKNLPFEVRKLKADDLDIKPQVFATDGYPQLVRHFNWGMIFKPGCEKPGYYMRSMTRTGYRSGTVCVLGDSPLEGQSPSPYFDRMAQKMETEEPYRKVCDDPVTFMHNSKEPFTEFIYTEDGASWKESDVLDLKVEYFPFAFFAHEDSILGHGYMQQHLLYTGTFDGQPVRSLGCIDRVYMKADSLEHLKQDTDNIFIAFTFMSGIRKDGRKECAWVGVHKENGNGMAYYWLEGNEPVLSDEVYLEADWQQYPYAKDDPTVAYTNATWKFGGVTLHTNCKWGSKGHTQTPRLSLVGFSQTYGTWYEGDEPYEHEIYHLLCENHSATVENTVKAGFKVKEF